MGDTASHVGQKPVREYDVESVDGRGRTNKVHVQIMNEPSDDAKAAFNESVYRIQNAIVERVLSGQQEPSEAMKRALGV